MNEIENDKLLDLVSHVFALEIRCGHLKWKVSDLARISKVSRTLVYYHFGKNKLEILYSCLDIIASEFYGLSPTRTAMARSGNFLDSLDHSRKLFETTPELTMFYLKWYNTNSEIEKKLRNIDRRYQQRLQSIFPALRPKQIKALQAIFHGLVTSPLYSREIATEALKWLPLGAKTQPVS